MIELLIETLPNSRFFFLSVRIKRVRQLCLFVFTEGAEENSLALKRCRTIDAKS